MKQLIKRTIVRQKGGDLQIMIQNRFSVSWLHNQKKIAKSLNDTIDAAEWGT